MSSRALRKLQRERDLSKNGTTADAVNNDHDDTLDDDQWADRLSANDIKKVKPVNPFDLVNTLMSFINKLQPQYFVIITI